MRCEKCEKDDDKVVDTRPMGPDTIRRRRRCSCGHSWSTREIPHNWRKGVTMDEEKLRKKRTEEILHPLVRKYR